MTDCHHWPRDRSRPKLKIPKFKMGYQVQPTEILKGMGIGGLFLPGGLEEMLEKDHPYRHFLEISRVYHKSFIEVKEQGTEACGVTVADDDEMGFSIYEQPKPPPVDFVADHPFLFVIREEKTKIVLFIGQAINPSLDASLNIN
ncbi:hypothetical protein MLD38_000724 [Melastoma candidum]|uniref:Uncharacterized protein n=1 Tax=Melastoma candidum TaxID=119954 RepID=A0ACB9SCZ1_9MYRT|nr:hypothetical protein MLD38_000724 [Melastoma candidum]